MAGCGNVPPVRRASYSEPGMDKRDVPRKVFPFPDFADNFRYTGASIHVMLYGQWNCHVKVCVSVSGYFSESKLGKDDPYAGCLLGIFVYVFPPGDELENHDGNSR